MAARNSSPRISDSRSLTIIREFAAPKAAVFAAWTDPAQAQSWLGPEGFTGTAFEADFRPGGRWRGVIREDASGKELRFGGVYREIAAPDLLVFTFAWDGEDGPSGNETLVTISFAESGGRTTMTFQQSGFDTEENRDGHEDGWSSAFEKLAATVARRAAQ